MTQTPTEMSPGKKAQLTAKWARTMTKWHITHNWSTGAKWNIVDFGGKTKAESRGIVDLLAIRKDHHHVDSPGLKRGDLFEIVLIQVKGGSAPRPTHDDIARLSRVAKYHGAKTIVLAEWQRAKKFDLFKLSEKEWQSVSPSEVF